MALMQYCVSITAPLQFWPHQDGGKQPQHPNKTLHYASFRSAKDLYLINFHFDRSGEKNPNYKYDA
jgi:hypothetical protein